MNLKIKLNVGCGDLNLWPNKSNKKYKIPRKLENWRADWINVDKFKKGKDVVVMHVGRRIEFPDKFVDYIVTEHMLEHLNYFRRKKFIKEAHRVLKNGGNLRIAIPDAASKSYVQRQYGHKVDFTIERLVRYFSKNNWKINVLAYHDKSGNYHIKKNIDFKKGYIGRLSKIIEESLLIDCIKI